MTLFSAEFRGRDLVRVGPPFAWRSPPGMGQRVRLNSGGPRMLIVDLFEDRRLCAWRGHEAWFDYRALKPSRRF